MKIGVALSGCDIGGVAAYEVLRLLEQEGFPAGMISACGTPAATAMLYAYGCDAETCRHEADRFLQNAEEADFDLAVAAFSAALPLYGRSCEIPVVVSAVNVSDGKICAFAGEGGFVTDRLMAFPLVEPYDALSATVSPVKGLASYPFGGFRLCDFSVWYGIPVYPLKMAGYDKIISVAFLPGKPSTPYEALVKQRIAASAALADIHIPIAVDARWGLNRYIDAAEKQLRGQVEHICMKTLF